ncbi:hypothetical protein Poli38472_002180 [Pythium oligandrum]|uniref:1-phosphatidylinositol 4-kinase n=1 Tax=Pythium oligandrum TaxID=41045 RepID=A0A8K1FJL1_PYTOL|nr:hypothetical protein Poli38472_002180 [Pythium oligandrum]|eukprot:TMW63239.1 hypothetical protein Poli38472_002180 [Pythium oligandrum]
MSHADATEDKTMPPIKTLGIAPLSLASTASSMSSGPRSSTLLSRRSGGRITPVETSASFVIMSGYLRMRVAATEWRMKTWYCLLYRAQLYWYASQRDAARAQKLQGRVSLVNAQVSDGIGKLHVYKHAFTFETDRGEVFFCAAPTEDEQSQWIEQINAAVVQSENEGSLDSSHSTHCVNGEECVPVCDAAPLTMEEAIKRATASFSSATSCFACGIAFGLLRRHRRQCFSCHHAFCRLHCSSYAVVGSGATTTHTSPARSQCPRICDQCSYRQHFITFVSMFTSRAVRLLRHDLVKVKHIPFSIDDESRHAKMRRELATVVRNPASFTALNVLCLLKKYIDVPWMFTRTLCMLIPVFERDRASLDEYWVQILGLFLPLLRATEPFSTSMQFFLRFVFAVCRRSNAFALRTMWECLAFYEDARVRGDRMTMSYLMLLVYASSAFDGNSAFVLDKLLKDAPAVQKTAMVQSMNEFLEIRVALRDDISETLPALWFNAMCEQKMTHCRQLVLEILEVLTDVDELLTMFDPSNTEALANLLTMRPEAEFSVEECLQACDHSAEEEDAWMTAKERAFDTQAAFVERLTQISDELRQVSPVESRGEALCDLLCELQQQFIAATVTESAIANPDTCSLRIPLSTQPIGEVELEELAVLRVLPNEGKVFSTRSRAPTLIVFEAATSAKPAEKPPAKILRRESSMQETDSDRDSMEGIKTRPGRAGSRAVLGRQESQMLDAMLCGLDEDDTGSSVPESSPLSSVENSQDGDLSIASEDAAPPDNLLVEEARDYYLESAAASFRSTHFTTDGNTSMQKSWERQCNAIRATSNFRDLPGWTLVSVIAKSHDDLRQEVFAMQLMRNLLDIFQSNGLERLYLRPYRILCTGANVGLIETLTDALSIDAIKKQFGSLAERYGTNDITPVFEGARDAFIRSMAASSLYCYLFQIKDRHNGNIMLDESGHVLHIDFGFMMGIAPGGAFSLEDAPFKLTMEMVDLMGGVTSSGFRDFKQLFLEGFLAVRREYINLVALIHLTAEDSPFPCFQQQTPATVLQAFRRRLFLHDSDDSARARILRLVDKSYNHWGTRQYDKFQYASNGIYP